MGVLNMSVRLGTVPGWERSAGWAMDNRVYEGVGPTIDIFPEYAGEEIAEYWIKFDIIFYFCESPPISPVVIRTLRDTMVRQKFVIPLKEPVPSFDKWIEHTMSIIARDLAEDIHRMSIIEMGGLRKCGISDEENYIITVTDKGFTGAPPKIPKPIIEQIEYLEEQYEKAETKGKRISIRKAINKLKRQYGIPTEKTKKEE